MDFHITWWFCQILEMLWPFSTAMFWHIRQEKTYFAGKVLNFYQRNLIQNPSWSHNNSQEPWNIKSNILFYSPSLFLLLSVAFSISLVWMWITTDSVFVVQGGGNNHKWYYMIINQITKFPLRCWKRISYSDYIRYCQIKVIRNLHAEKEGISIFVHFAALT